MRRFRLSTLMLLIVIAALIVALVVQHRRAARREAELQARLARSWPAFVKQQQEDADLERLLKHANMKHEEALAGLREAEAHLRESKARRQP